SSSVGARATALAASASDSLNRSSISLAAIARSRHRCSGLVGGAASSRASKARKLAGVRNCKPRCEKPFAIRRALRSLTCPRVGTTTSEGNGCFQAPGPTSSNQGPIASSHASLTDSATSRTGRDRFIILFDSAKRAPIAHAPCEAFAIESFKKWNHDSPRTFQRLSQFADRCRSLFGNEISDCTFHALKVLAQQHHVRGDFNHFSSLDRKFESSLLVHVSLKVFARRRIEWFPG